MTLVMQHLWLLMIINDAGMFPTDDEVDDLLTHMDQDKSGMVDQEELIRQMSHQVNGEKNEEELG